MKAATPKTAPEQQAVRLCKLFEGCHLTAYADPVGIVTIGYGHTRTAKAGMVITQAQAEALLAEDLAGARASVRALVDVPLTPGQEDALTLLVYNIGSGNFSGSTLRRLLNAGSYSGAEEQFARWRKAGGKVFKGLVIRRCAERFVWHGLGAAITPSSLRAMREMF